MENYTTPEGMVFTPRYDADGVLIMTAEESYGDWAERRGEPAVLPPTPTLEDRVADVEAVLAEMAYGGDAV